MGKHFLVEYSTGAMLWLGFGILTDFCHLFAMQCFTNVSKPTKNCDKNVAKTPFCHIFVTFHFKMFPQNVSNLEQKCEKKCQKY